MLVKKLKTLNLPLISILIVALILRLICLDLRPPHHDEGINGWFVDQITAKGFYGYDPTNYHGPLHFYIMFVFQTLFGRNNWVLRLPTVIFSLLSVYWLYLFSPFIGKKTALIAAIAMALSPSAVFYGRYAIHESDFVFFSILVLWGIIGLYKEGTRKYLWSIGLGITGLILTKETYIIHIGCLIIAWIFLKYVENFSPSQDISKAKQVWVAKDLLQVIICGFFLIIFFYSGTFFNFKGVLDLIESLQLWFNTGTSPSGHTKPFYYWINLFFRYEHIALIGSIACLKYLKPSSMFLRYIAIYGCGVLLSYSIIPYKTPWCIINMTWPFYFVFGDLIKQFLKTKWERESLVIATILFIISIFLTLRLNLINYVNNKEPYVYVHTSNDIKKITGPLFALVKINPLNYNLTGHIISESEWPLPWILGDFTMIGYYKDDLRPLQYDADFLVVKNSAVGEIEKHLTKKYFTSILTIRDSHEPSKLYLNYVKFKKIFPQREAEFTPLSPLDSLFFKEMTK